MKERQSNVHPYIPNTVPKVKAQMMQEIGIASIEELYRDIPQHLRMQSEMDLPPALNEFELKGHIERLLAANVSTSQATSFLGGGCWQHFVPAVCDEINQRSEFVTAYAGEPYEDHGRFQALFEYQSLVAELVDMDVVNVPTFDWPQAASTALRMAARMTGRTEVLLPAILCPDKRMIIKNYLHPHIRVITVQTESDSGLLDLNDLRSKLSDQTAAVYIENPNYFGIIERQGEEINRLAREYGAISVVGVDPISLGVLTPPSQYGADIVCGDLQPLGIRMNYGGGQSGFIAVHDEERFVMEYPSRLFGIVPTVVEGEYGFGDVAYERTSFAQREQGKESVGTQTALWGITAGVYLALLGPHGMYEIGETIMQKSRYAAARLSTLSGVALRYENAFFKEFVIDFTATGLTVSQINEHLLTRNIFGGLDLSGSFPEMGQSALFCVTEVMAKEQIDHLVDELTALLNKTIQPDINCSLTRTSADGMSEAAANMAERCDE
ncbi:aminomethyl-transferring glycine dehydrogenase subunit GcvPA [Paenibacillus sp. S-12]|uniref:aminomethyl-transferring glycine dehydrogenase subunit GcvPA n=1 Tax=unclassified Paenibacillus TaxID=185978 RepID=UPI0025A00288|nr:aminomethyl-transferring glycine dehydrogenase subunit GcvPA [Paenibacillus sp. S-12]